MELTITELLSATACVQYLKRDDIGECAYKSEIYRCQNIEKWHSKIPTHVPHLSKTLSMTLHLNATRNPNL